MANIQIAAVVPPTKKQKLNATRELIVYPLLTSLVVPIRQIFKKP